jgi:calcium-dependent protein kinase
MGQKQMCEVQELLSTFNSVEFHHFGLKLSKGFCEQVLKSELDFVSDPWLKIAETAKDLLWRMLNPNAGKRLKAHQVLCHPWICEDGVAPDRPSDSAVQTRLKNFSAMNKLKKMAICVIAESLSEEEIAGLKEMFKMMDSDDSGSISFEELKEGLKEVGSNLMEEDIRQLMDAADVDQNGTIDYGFLAVTLNLNEIEQEENLLTAFSCKNGYLTTDELQQACIDFHMGVYLC